MRGYLPARGPPHETRCGLSATAEALTGPHTPATPLLPLRSGWRTSFVASLREPGAYPEVVTPSLFVSLHFCKMNGPLVPESPGWAAGAPISADFMEHTTEG